MVKPFQVWHKDECACFFLHIRTVSSYYIMNHDIEKMLELQGFWDKVMEARAVIEQQQAKIRGFQEEIAGLKAKRDEMNSSINRIRNAVKSYESEMKDMEERISRLEAKRMIVTTERELNAVDKEIDMIRFDKESIEEKAILLLEECEKMEGERAVLEEELSRRQSIAETECPILESELARQKEIATSYEEKFRSGMEFLSPSVRPRFLKMIQSKGGKAIGRLEGETCGSCNFIIPAHLALEAGRDDAIVICTNCGRFLYR